MPDASSLAEQLRLRRGALGLTQAELAERAGISERAVSDIERGLRKHVYRDTAQRLATALQLRDGEAAAFQDVARGRTGATEWEAPAGPPAPIVGRGSELAAVTAQLLDPQTRLLTLTGPGGVGKTRIALELQTVLAAEFPAGVTWVPLGGLRSPELVLPAIAAALRMRGGPDLLGSLAERLTGQRRLLVLDTMEHLLGAAPELAALAGRLADAKMLVTSRVPINIRAERVWPVPPLAEADAMRMFEACVMSMAPGSGATLTAEVTADICRRLEGIPLAIELAAARTRFLAPADINAHLRTRLALLAGGPVDLPERQRSMAATVAWSYDLLPSGARRLLEELSVFAGGWTVGAAVDVCHGDGVAVDLGDLVASSLVTAFGVDGDGMRYRMLDTVREYATTRLEARIGDGGVESLRRGHAEWYRALAEECEPRLRSGDHRSSLARLALERDNLRAALEWAIASGDDEGALRLASALWMFWRLSGAFSEGRVWLRQVLSMDSSAPRHVWAAALWGAGWLAYQQADFEETAARGAELTGWARKAGDSIALRNGVTLLGQASLAEGDFTTASQHFDEALQLAERDGSPWILATSRLNRAVAALHAGDQKLSAALLAQAEEGYREIGDERFVARVWLQRAYLALLRGDLDGGRRLVTRGVAQAWALDDIWALAEQLDAMSAVLAAGGELLDAARVAGAAAAAWEGIGAGPHPADRRSVERWLEAPLDGAGKRAYEEGRGQSLGDVVESLAGPASAQAGG